MLLACLMAVVYGMLIFPSGGSVDGQTPRDPALAPAPPAKKSEPLPAPWLPVTLEALEPLSPGSFARPISFNFTIKADTPLKDLLPTPPKSRSWWVLDDEGLSQIPEVAFQEPLDKSVEMVRDIAHTVAKINHLNRQQTDGFMKALVNARADLAGLPVTMGEACRTTPIGRIILPRP